MADWIIGFIEQGGYGAIALLMLLENVFPPIPSELIMPFAGFAAARGALHPVGVVLAGTAGAVAGATFWYAVARAVGAERLRRWASRHGRWLTVSPADLDRAAAWFERRGHLAIFIGRLLPAFRTLVSVPAGFAGLPAGRFLFWTTLGSATWTLVLTAAGFLLGSRYGQAASTVNWAANCIFIALAGCYLWRVATYKDTASPPGP